MNRTFSALLALALTTSFHSRFAYSEEDAMEFAGEVATDRVNSIDEQKPVLKYFWYENENAAPQAYFVDQATWTENKSDDKTYDSGHRRDLLSRVRAASVSGVSKSGHREWACFTGSAADLKEAFFKNDSHKVMYVSGSGIPETTASEDGMQLGIRYTESVPNGKTKNPTVKSYFFRLQHCLAGKAAIGLPGVKVSKATLNNPKFAVTNTDIEAGRIPSSSLSENGFDILDRPKATAGLPTFSLKSDYDQAKSVDDRPWKGLDLSKPADARKFAVIMQKYVYEGMAAQNATNADQNFIAQNNKTRYWCHMPWLNVGPSGREGIHGLTKERDINASPTMKVYSKATAGSDWGVGYYNAPGCQSIGKVFGPGSKPVTIPDFKSVSFPDGTVTFKILFTTANFKEVAGAYTWNANVSGPGLTARSVQPVRHVQMDVAVKDSSLKGVKGILNNWVMLTYYFDGAFDYTKEYADTGAPLVASLKATLGTAQQSLLKMRPMGIQAGFEEPAKGDSMIFAGSETNGLGGRLNGPADNPKSSCLGCHGTAGTGKSMVPGLVLNTDYAKTTGALDFSQQMALGKRNYETQSPK